MTSRSSWRPPRVLRACIVQLGLGCLAQPAWAVTVTRPTVLRSLPHDPEAFTEGLFVHDGALYESTGLLGHSTLREVRPDSGEILRQIELPADEFGEGIARVKDAIWMLTWKNQLAHRFLVADFSLERSVQYEGEGWGLCFDGERLVMSDGSSSLQFRDPHSFELLGQQEVTRDGRPVLELNELECAGGFVYANVWHTSAVLQIEPGSGNVVSQIDISGLLTPEDAAGVDVPNGIAYDPSTGHFFLTGKYWPKVFEVTFDAVSAPSPPILDAGVDAALEAGAQRPDLESTSTGGRSAPRTSEADAGCSVSGGPRDTVVHSWWLWACAGLAFARNSGGRRLAKPRH